MLKYIPLSKIDRIQIYINQPKKSLAKTLTQIKKETGADDIINAGFFNGNWTPCGHVKADGVVYVGEPYIYNCMAWNNPPLDLCMTPIPTNKAKYSNYISCVALIVNGKKDVYAISQADNAVGVGKLANGNPYYTRRSAVGMKNGQLALYCDTKGLIPSQLADLLYSQGWSELLMLDGGGSVQCNFEGKTITSTRIVHNFILVYYKKDKQPIPTPTPPVEEKPKADTGLKINEVYMKNNRCYTNQIKRNKTKMMLHSTGTPNAMFEAIFNSMNKTTATLSVESIIDNTGIYKTLPYGIKSWHCASSGNDTHIACEICEPQDTRLLDINWKPLSKGGFGNTTWAVTQLQKELIAWGYNPNGVDGSFGDGCDKAVKAFQSANSLVADGSVGLGTLHALQKRVGSLLKYDAKKNEEYFNNVYNKAVYYFATTLKEIGGKASEIVCHSEGYKLGIASNHADVMHWFPQHGKSMDTFRADVAKAMAGEVRPIEPEKPKPVLNNVVEAQTLLNNKFNSGLVVDGSWGPASKKALIKAIQSTLNIVYNRKLTLDGSFGPASQTACPDLKYYVKNDLAYCLQLGLLAKGFDIDVDGSYGRGTETIVKQYQASCGLNVDGVAGPNTFVKLVS